MYGPYSTNCLGAFSQMIFSGVSTKQLIVREIPNLRRYARSLCRNREDADDLVQSTLERALGRLYYWKKGSDMRAWLFTIMHNLWVNDIKKLSREAQLIADEDLEPTDDRTPENQGLAIRDFERSILKLSDDHREALLLVTMQQFSYKEAARIAGISIGTLMSRLHRARKQLHNAMYGEQTHSLRRVK